LPNLINVVFFLKASAYSLLYILTFQKGRNPVIKKITSTDLNVEVKCSAGYCLAHPHRFTMDDFPSLGTSAMQGQPMDGRADRMAAIFHHHSRNLAHGHGVDAARCGVLANLGSLISF